MAMPSIQVSSSFVFCRSLAVVDVKQADGGGHGQCMKRPDLECSIEGRRRKIQKTPPGLDTAAGIDPQMSF